ncbi:sulfite exporter TauE/SafE family protein [Crocinitomicaceae bacterium]|nr:sulfite exporter TauE/SafE family protein [Crocinitomicaceae bacterium]
MAIPIDRSSNHRILFGALQYNIGRIITYSLLGIVAGSMGLTMNTYGFLQWLSIIAGGFLVLFAWRKYLYFNFKFRVPGTISQFGLQKLLGKIIRSKSPIKLLLLGGINGLLPCGIVFLVLMNAVLTGEIAASSLAMITFGIGTLPAMLAVTYATNNIGVKLRAKLNRSVPILLTFVGIIIILRGMNLNVPYISPGISRIEHLKATESGKTLKQDIEMNCCHNRQDCE